MKILTLNEETILIAHYRLGGQGHGPLVREKLSELTGKSIVYGTLYNSLEYLIRKGYVESQRGEPTPTRGGKAKSIYRITSQGRQALLDTRNLRDQLWRGLNDTDIKPEKISQ